MICILVLLEVVGRQIHDADLVKISALLQLAVAVLESKYEQKGTLHTSCNLAVFGLTDVDEIPKRST